VRRGCFDLALLLNRRLIAYGRRRRSSRRALSEAFAGAYCSSYRGGVYVEHHAHNDVSAGSPTRSVRVHAARLLAVALVGW
jgi:hypothetical protein